ncbi:6-hydroxy-D-nicotine oxidase [Cytospora mali]|uniref:6-hydroxy-D-nicotine oxidase n=1 Tax=Cytospora mali TaxID=578113 RepID=A0A194VVE6_CYTMA|nr:6-hydroxy-D-nicotine oxidase [Valsa mali]
MASYALRFVSKAASCLVFLTTIPQSEGYATGSALITSTATSISNGTSTCRCYPTDTCWPTAAKWAEFNTTVGGRLVATVPIASVCHYDNFTAYNAEACAALLDVWDYPQTHDGSSSSPMAQFFTNGSCNPYTAPSDPCVVGALVQYSVNVSAASLSESIADYRATLAFASEHNIRLVVRNTGHDYFGKSTGPGALALWTHHLKDIELVDYWSSYYTGKALSLGAGVQIHEAYEAAGAAGLVVVGGNCGTVGLAGGYSQGGGHGPLASSFGLGADNVLQWEVITAEGAHVVAKPGTDYEDLYWALSGGGGGTYAAVLSVTVRAHPDMTYSGANLSIVQGSNVSDETFYGIVQTFIESAPKFADLGVYTSWALQEGIFVVEPAIAANVRADTLRSLFNPTLAALNESGMYFAFFIDDFASYLDVYNAVVPVNNVTEYNIGGRLIPRSLVEANITALMTTLKYIVAEGSGVSGVSVNVSSYPLNVANSVNPVWRTSIYSFVLGLPLDVYNISANIPIQEEITNDLMPSLEAITPRGGAYLNEADFRQPDFQDVFYGDNYATLLAIKDKYDPEGLFYGVTAVGSERWASQSDGKLCLV